MQPEKQQVRPTRNVLRTLGLASLRGPLFPFKLHVDLAEIDHDLVRKAQEVPQKHLSRAAERIKSLKDRVWYKVKVNDDRGGVTDLGGDGESDLSGHPWWLGLAGKRRSDSPQDDFYSTLPECTDDCLPVQDDWDRLAAETVTRAKFASQRLVRRAAYCSMMSSGSWVGFTLTGDQEVRARLRVIDDCAYLSLGGVAIQNSQHFVLILSAFPDISIDDWMPESQGPLHLQLEPGEIIFSAMVDPSIQAELYQEFCPQD